MIALVTSQPREICRFFALNSNGPVASAAKPFPPEGALCLREGTLASTECDCPLGSQVVSMPRQFAPGDLHDRSSNDASRRNGRFCPCPRRAIGSPCWRKHVLMRLVCSRCSPKQAVRQVHGGEPRSLAHHRHIARSRYGCARRTEKQD